MTRGNYTAMDSLKQITKQGLISAREIDKLLNPEARVVSTPEEVNALQEQSASLPQEIKEAIAHLKVLQSVLNTALTEQVVHSDEPDAHHYTDGRRVMGTIEVDGQTFEHVWHPDAADPRNLPAPGQPAVVEVKTASGRMWKLFIAEPSELGAYELGDELNDRL